jgi:NAD(P)H-quinone oxidoreductase subunit 5
MQDGSTSDRLPALSTYATWSLFVLAVGFVAATVRVGATPSLGRVARVDGLTAVMWIAVTFFSGIVQSFSRRYMAADADMNRFFRHVFGFTLAVLVLVAADHVVLFLAAWTAMGLLMAALIGHVDGWREARIAGGLARRYFLAGSLLLGAGLVLLVYGTGSTTVTGILASLDALSRPMLVLSGALVVAAALVQSALLPFHGWLLSSMTAPTPSSALMHAGFVNAGGVLLTRFAPLVAAERPVLLALAVAGASSSLLAQAMMLVQPSYKGRLGCSTVAQMGFMILQCGLGFFAAAVTHLIVHGFYKAYLFLSTGSQVSKKPAKGAVPDGLPALPTLAVAVPTAVAGGVVFATLTGKSLAPSSSGVFLAAVVVVSVFRGATELLEARSLSPALRLLGMPVVLVPTLGLYALVYRGVSGLLGGLPSVYAPVEMSAAHWALLGLFLAGHLAVQMGWLQRHKRLYVALLNAGQPHPGTVATAPEYGSRSES